MGQLAGLLHASQLQPTGWWSTHHLTHVITVADGKGALEGPAPTNKWLGLNVAYMTSAHNSLVRTNHTAPRHHQAALCDTTSSSPTRPWWELNVITNTGAWHGA